jgi:hypothetical protein
MKSENPETSPIDEEDTSSTSAIEPLVFTTTDPMGRMVKLKQSTWDMHVVNGDHQRIEFIGQEQLVKDVISDPTFIVPDAEIGTRERYYDLAYFSNTGKLRPVMVVVDHDMDTGDVCTLFTQSRMRETGERGIVYARKKN